VAGPAGRVLQRDGAEGVGEPLAHLRRGLVDQDRTDPDPLVGDHAAGAALQVVPAPGRHVTVVQELPALVGAAALGLGADLEDRQDLEPRPLDSQLAEQLEEALLAGVGTRLAADFGDGDDRVEARRHEIADAAENALEGAGAADGIVARGVVAVERDAEVERIVGRLLHRLEPGAARGGEEQAVGQHVGRSDLQRRLQDRLHVRIEERLAAGEVVLPDAERGGFVERALHRVQPHHFVRMVGRRAGDEAVRAGEVADRAAHLEPEGVERL